MHAAIDIFHLHIEGIVGCPFELAIQNYIHLERIQRNRLQVGLDDVLELRLFDYSVEGGLALAVVDVFVVVVIAGIVGVVGVYISLVVWQPDSVAESVLGEIVGQRIFPVGNTIC